MRGLTPKQQKVLDFIRQYIREHGYPPTLREIGHHFGISSTNGVNDHLKALTHKGYLTRKDMKSRSLRPVNLAYEDPSPFSLPPTRSRPPPSRNTPSPSETEKESEDLPASIPASSPIPSLIPIKILGRVAAGTPILAEENVIEQIHIERNMLRLSSKSDTVFGLRISGESMVEAGIFHGDYIFVRRSSTARRGDIVVALIGEEATVKYYYPEKDRIRFQPANGRMEPIFVHASEMRNVTLLGTVCGVYRRMLSP